SEHRGAHRQRGGACVAARAARRGGLRARARAAPRAGRSLGSARAAGADRLRLSAGARGAYPRPARRRTRMLSRPTASDPPAPTLRATGAAATGDDAERWLQRLRSDGPARDHAVADLHALLLRAARFTVRRAGGGGTSVRETYEDLAQQSADDALVAVLGKLDSFRGESRFT